MEGFSSVQAFSFVRGKSSTGASTGRSRSLPAVRLEIAPKPEPDVRAAIARVLEASDGQVLAPAAFRSRWRLAGLRFATGRPRRRRGAARA